MVDQVRTPTGILSYPHLFKPRPVNEGGEPRYSLVLIFDEAAQQSKEFKALRDLANKKAVEFFGDRLKAPGFAQRLRKPFRACAEKAGTAGYDVKNGVFISAWSKEAPRVVGPDTHDITVPGDVFPGQRARIDVSAFAYDTNGNVGVSFGLQQVQITKRNMPRLDGRTTLPWDRSTEEDEDDAFGNIHAPGANAETGADDWFSLPAA
jgi:hypothetical protein